jgi:transposase
METIYEHCAGLDVHKDSVVACVRHWHNGRVEEEVRSFGSSTRALLALGDWLSGEQVTHVAMESTGVYWKPVWNLLEDRFQLLLVNASHVKQVPGRKTDMKDCQWIAQLLQHGLLKPSFVPDRPQRDLRDLTRQRWQLIAERARVSNRIQKILEDANIKLGSVASDVLGVSGRKMIEALIAGELSPAAMAQMARQRLREKIPQLMEALSGKVTEHHRFMLKMLMEQVQWLEKQIELFDQRIEAVMGPFEKRAMQLLDTIPGINARAAQNIVAEIGSDMSRFPTAGHLAVWSGMCPGNHQSAGKRKRGKTTEGNRWLKATLTQCAWAASRTKNTYLSRQYRHLSARRGKKRAAIAVGHSQLVAAWHLIKNGEVYADLGPNHLDKVQGARQVNHLVKRLERLGYKVDLKAAA